MANGPVADHGWATTVIGFGSGQQPLFELELNVTCAQVTPQVQAGG